MVTSQYVTPLLASLMLSLQTVAKIHKVLKRSYNLFHNFATSFGWSKNNPPVVLTAMGLTTA